MRSILRLKPECQIMFRIVVLAFLLTGLVGTFAVRVTAYDTATETRESTKKLLKKAKSLLRKGQFEESAKIIKTVLLKEPENETAILDLSYVYLKQKKLVDSYELAFDLAIKNPKNAYAFSIVGALQLTIGNLREARILLTNAIALDKRQALAWASLGMLDYYENRVSESILNLKEAVLYDDREPDFAYALAQVSSRGELYRESAAAYDRFLRIAPDTDLDRRNRIKGLIRFLRFLGSRTRIYEIGGEKETTVTIREVNNRPIVPIQVGDNKEQLNFVLDTGSGITVISQKTADRLKIRTVARGGMARALGGNGKFEIVYGFIDVVRIGDVKVKNVPVYIRDFHESTATVDGYIGVSLISKFITTLDYKNKLFTLVDKTDFVEPVPDASATIVPLRMTSSGFLSGHVQILGIDSVMHFILDTGASVSVVSEDLAEKDEISRHLMKNRMRVIGAAGITEDVPLYMLKDLSFGGISKSELRAVALDMDVLNETAGFHQAGILGGNFLKDYKLTFDFGKSKVTFVPN